ncbi:cytochrome b [Acidovorax sp. SRB_14]|uniref:cytochrome b n=1 Tax=unclassified Acidovorax TaxID=2684926 RepID=UPI00145D861B|nr:MULTISPECIES: cytochrome b/b6 domain-containing protein [unclassified Acidovorax]NMM76096.1 cytochrome b [Acidovorax sp. SRB_24]NMM82439.1 cytochrome b [Acidovorax sp. SRB_14]NMM86439.1 cytochrome b [Rhodococcus sp. SRB_17]
MPSSSPTAPARSARYSHTAIALHWLLAAALMALFALGLYMADLPFSPQRLKLYNWHKWAGVAILTLSLLRLLWRLTHRPPALPATMVQAMPAWQKWAHHGTHHLLYALFFAVPLIGWAYSSAAGFPIVFLGLVQLPDFVPASDALAEALKPWHQISAYALAALAGLHVAAAFKHQWIDRDGLLTRMWPGRR